MTILLRFYTSAFDITKERPNPINPIPGESLLLWLIEKSGGLVTISPPDAEDWGWYSCATWKGREYLLGASVVSEDHVDAGGGADAGELEWILMIEKRRSLKEKILGRAKMTADDECAACFQSLLEGEPRFQRLTVESGDPSR